MMNLRVALLFSLLVPVAAGAQKSLAHMPQRLGATISGSPESRSHTAIRPGAAGNDSIPSSLNTNLIRGAAVGGVIGGIIGALASEHQAVAAGFTHTPAVLFVATYGGLGVLLGIIAGTLLPGS